MKPLLFLIFVFLASGCTKILMNAYGIRQPKLLSRQEISNKSSELNIPDEKSFILDKKYFYALEQRDTLKPLFEKKCSPMISKYQQPLQAMYFDENGELVSFHNNCYAGGFPILKWNKHKQFDEFIPVTTIPITDTALNLGLLLQYLEPIGQANPFERSKWTAIVFWCDFMKKQSKELIKIVTRNLFLDDSHSARILFVNTDNCFIDEKYSNQVNKVN